MGSFDQIRGMIDEELEGVWSGKKTAKSALMMRLKGEMSYFVDLNLQTAR
ncbi:MAG: hypothetical protein CM1200mP28_01980 [Deltaproteobacteria bacterium]|nr:MAG: hypothetical protein CM1200mP28_01980 [Deltaproteobacteria bacterium]